MKKLVLIDGMAVTYRAYHGFSNNPLYNSKGLNVSAILGFTTTLYDLIRKQHPSHIAVAFDLQKPTFRHERYIDYKANREAMPEGIQVALPHIMRIIEAFQIPVLTAEGYEADDVIGTAASWAEAADFDNVLMVTPDKDFAQLVTNRVHLYRLGRMSRADEVYTPERVCESFGVSRCSQVADILGLWGDSIDNIPGIAGVGEKTAKKLIAQFDSVENTVAHADEIANVRLRNLVKEGAERALLSKELATICCSVPIVLSESLLELRRPDYDVLSQLLKELEFRNFAKKLFTDLSVSDPDTAMKFRNATTASTSESDSARQASLSDSLSASQTESPQLSLFDAQEKQQPVELVVEPLGKLLEEQQPTDFAIYMEGATICLSTSADNVWTAMIGDINLDKLREWIEEPSTLKVCHNLKQLKTLLEEIDMRLGGQIFDCEMAHYLIDAESRHSLEFICQAVLGTQPANAQASSAALWQLYPLLSSKLVEGEFQSLYYDVELPLIDVLYDMEREGVNIDTLSLKDYSDRLSDERAAIEQDIYKQAGEPFNINSPKQLGQVLYEKLKVTDRPPRTSTKQYSTAEDTLVKFKSKHPIIDKILEYRSLSKLIGTYLDSFPKLISPATGRLHTLYNQTTTATGRLSSSHPNLQNIPIRTDRGREIRKAFVPRNDNYLIMAADYSQIELRIIAALAHDEHMIAAFEQHLDIHAATAAKIYKTDLSEVSKTMRQNAKSVNFGIVYGISSFGLSEQLGIARKEAADLIDEYFAQYPSIKLFIDESIAFARSHGYAQTLLGRRRYLPDINSRNSSARTFSERNAVNMPIQGTSADMIKIAMNNIYRRINENKLQSKMILQVHDELIFDLYKSEEAIMRSIVEEEMVNAIKLDIPIEVSIGVGKNWLEAH